MIARRLAGFAKVYALATLWIVRSVAGQTTKAWTVQFFDTS